MITQSLPPPLPALAPAPASLPAGQRVYAIGDVHGCLDKLRALHRAIARDLRERPVEGACLVHLGDYIDRGPDSAGVVATLRAPFGDGATGVRVVNLLGNHEEMMLYALEAPGVAEHWLFNGGGASLASWGVPPDTPARAWKALLPPEDLAFLRALPLMHAAGGYLFVHAGLRPRVPLAGQSRQDMLWIREPFLSDGTGLPAIVVHGHTPCREVDIRPHRIGIDTAACMGGHLTCLVLQAAHMSVLQA